MTASPALLDPPVAIAPVLTHERVFAFVGERLWLDFVNSDGVRAIDALRDFDTLMSWLEAAALVDARRVRGALRSLAERGSGASIAEQIRTEALNEINRVLGRSAGTRRVERRGDGAYARTFVPVGDAFAGLMIPIVESAADALILGELPRVRRCADARCARVFYDGTKNGRRRWCDMATCGNRAKAARHRQKLREIVD